jgi:hypothetical protein
MPRKSTEAAPFDSIEGWLEAHPSDEVSAKERFAAIPAEVAANISRSLTYTGEQALTTWQTVSLQLKLFQQSFATATMSTDPRQYFANIGFFTTLASLFEDRLNAMYVHRSSTAFGAAYSEKNEMHVSIPAKAGFLRDAGDISADDRAACVDFTRWRNAIAHQAHYHNELLCSEVYGAVHALFLAMQRMRARQKTIIKNELKRFPTVDAQQAAVQLLCESLTGSTTRAYLHSQLGGGTGSKAPFRHGAPIYVVRSPRSSIVTVIDAKQQSHTTTCFALSGVQWQVPVFEQQNALVYTGIHTVTLHVNGRSTELVC